MKAIRSWAALISSVLALTCVAAPSMADSYPSSPIHLVVGFPPGGINDIVARVVGERLSAKLGQSVVVENRAGAGGIIGANFVAKAKPDGYTLLLGSVSNLAMAPGQHAKLPFSPTKDFAPISLVAAAPNVLVVNPSFKVRTVKDIIDKARSEPGKIMYASAGEGTSNHLTGVLLASLADIKLVHVPYKGDSPGLADVVAGRVPMMFPTIPVAAPFIKSGQVKAIAVSSVHPSALLPGVPTVAQAGGPKGFDVSVWVGILAPRGTPRTVVEKIDGALKEILANPDMRKRLQQLGVESTYMDSKDFAEYLQQETTRWSKLAKLARQS